ncbi:type IV toxin-antitoxin system AbiEi family antitoxin domain-containing protein [Actinomycetes bacterium KLBMP 9797]
MARVPRTHHATTPKIDLDALFRAQRGIATRRQLLRAGLDDEAIRREVHGNRWQRLLPGLFASFTGPPTDEHRRVAAAIYAPVGAQITGVAALRWYGFRHLPDDDRIHLLIPHTSRRTSRGFVLFQRTDRLDSAAKRQGPYTVCSVARAVADAARQLNDLRAVRALVAEAVQRRFTDVPSLRRELDAAQTHRTRLLRVAVNEVDQGVRSAPEAELAADLKTSSILPTVQWNPTLVADDGSELPGPDGWIQESGIALEVDSREYHLNPEDWRRTIDRHNRLAAHGALVLHFTPSEIRRNRARVRRIIETAHLERISSGVKVSIRVA